MAKNSGQKRAAANSPPRAEKSPSGSLTPLNFKVPEEFHREFKTYAAQHSKTMVEVLQEAFSLLKERGA